MYPLQPDQRPGRGRVVVTHTERFTTLHAPNHLRSSGRLRANLPNLDAAGLGGLHWIQTQFLVETAIISAFGGLHGIVLGVGAVVRMTIGAGGSIPRPCDAVFRVSAAIGIACGICPACKRPELDPIELPRYE
jgi:hypothetical protein